MFKGCATALITPFKNGEIDYNIFAKQIDYQIKNNINALVVCGTTGEPCSLNENEYNNVLNFVSDYVNKKITIIASCGSNCTKKAIDLSQKAENLGYDELLMVTPYYNKCSQSGLIKHYSTIANAVNLPIILYNVPARTNVNIELATLKKLSKIENIVALKEASGDLVKAIAVVQETDLDLYCGDDLLLLPFLSIGGKGIISVASNLVPNDIVNICNYFFLENFKDARNLQKKITPLLKALSQDINPIPIKTAMKIANFDSGELRLPLTNMDINKYKVLNKVIKKLFLDNSNLFLKII